MAKQAKEVKEAKVAVPPVFEGFTQTGVIVKGGINHDVYAAEEVAQGRKIRDCGAYVEIYSKSK